MTLSARPQVVTTDDANFQTLIKTTQIVETVGLNGQLVVDAANQVVQGVPALVQAQTAVALVGVNSAIAAAQAAQVTDKKFISSSVSFPVAPTSTDLTTYPGDILGSRLDTNGAVQRTLWNRTNAVWQDNGAPLATRADTDAAAALGTSALQALGVTRAQLLTGTLNVGTAGRVLGDSGIFNVLPNAQAGAVDNNLVFQLANGQRAVRNTSSTGFLTSAQFGVPTDGVTDAGPALQAAINAAIAQSLELRLAPGVYVTSTELLAAGTVNLRAAGNGFAATTTIRAGTAGMRSVLTLAGQFSRVTGIVFDAAKLADYAVMERGNPYSTYDNCGYINAVLDNLHRSSTTTAGTAANNDGTEYKNCVWNNAGRVFGTAAMLARAEYGTSYNLANQFVTVGGTVSVTSGGTVLTGTGTTFLSTRARRGDTVRLGDGWQDSQPPVLLEILSVDSNTQITLAEPSPLTLSAQKYAVHVGDNFHEEDALDNNVSRIYGGFSRGAAGSAHLWAGAYGNVAIGHAADFNLGWGFRVGRRQGTYHNFQAMFYAPYFEANFFGMLDFGKSIRPRLFGGQDGTAASAGPVLRVNPVAGEVREGLLVGFGSITQQIFGTVYPNSSSGFTLPRSGLSATGDLSSSAYWANKFPVGLTVTAINGATNCPGTSNLGVLETLIDPTYLTDGGGFGWQKFTPAASAGAAYIRYGSSIAANVAWGPWCRMSFSPQTAPADLTAAPTAADFNALKNLLKTAGVLS